MATGDEDFFNKIIDGVASLAQATGYFDRVNKEEPINAPGTGITLALWLEGLYPYPAGSGLATVTAVLKLAGMIMTPESGQPFERQDPAVLAAAWAFMNALAGDFDLSSPTGTPQVRNVDLKGAAGQGALTAQATYVELGDGARFRTLVIMIPLVVNDVWAESA